MNPGRLGMIQIYIYIFFLSSIQHSTQLRVTLRLTMAGDGSKKWGIKDFRHCSSRIIEELRLPRLQFLSTTLLILFSLRGSIFGGRKKDRISHHKDVLFITELNLKLSARISDRQARVYIKEPAWFTPS